MTTSYRTVPAVLLFTCLMAGTVIGAEGEAKDYIPTIMAGSLDGVPPDSPADRVDPNVPESLFGGVVSLRVGGNSVCSGVAISPYHILTAAHCFDIDADGINDRGTDVDINVNLHGDLSTVYDPQFIRRVDINPDFTGFNNPSLGDDLAVVSLYWPLPDDVPTYGLYRGTPQTGDELTLVGYGRSGRGDVGYSFPSSHTVKRVGSNVVDVILPDDEGSGRPEVWEYDFDGPEGNGSMGGPTLGNDIETTIGPGDSGGPGFINIEDELQVYSINTFTIGSIGNFGTEGGGILVSSYLDWLDPFLQYLDPIPGDINWDGVVNDADLTIFLPTWGGVMGEPGYSAGSDINRDGVIGQKDLGLLLANFGQGRSRMVPAPPTVFITTFCLAGMTGRRRKYTL